VDIHIVSHAKDAEWCRYAIRSIRRFATGFGGVTLVVPSSDAARFAGLADALVLFDQRRWQGFLHHQIMVQRADEACPSADFIVHMDSDCVFVEPVTPAEYVRNGKAVMLRERYDIIRAAYTGRFRSGAGRRRWQRPTERALGFPVEYETMVRHPAVHPRALYPELRAHIERTHGMPFDDYVFGCGRLLGWGSRLTCPEFPILGAYALARHPDWYEWIDALSPHENFAMQKAPGVREKMRQFHAPDGVRKHREELERLLA
jgi:hypothetical protein